MNLTPIFATLRNIVPKSRNLSTSITHRLFFFLSEISGLIRSQEKEIDLLKAKIAQDLAVMPQDSFGPAPTSTTSKLRLNSEVRVGGSKMRGNESPCPGCTVSNLDPNATAYTPKGSLVTSTEAWTIRDSRHVKSFHEQSTFIHYKKIMFQVSFHMKTNKKEKKNTKGDRRGGSWIIISNRFSFLPILFIFFQHFFFFFFFFFFLKKNY